MHDVELHRLTLRQRDIDPDTQDTSDYRPGSHGGLAARPCCETGISTAPPPFTGEYLPLANSVFENLNHTQVLRLARSRSRKLLVAQSGISVRRVSLRIEQAIEWERSQSPCIGHICGLSRATFNHQADRPEAALQCSRLVDRLRRDIFISAEHAAPRSLAYPAPRQAINSLSSWRTRSPLMPRTFPHSVKFICSTRR